MWALVLWILFGALTGWVVALMLRTGGSTSWVPVLIGVVGAVMAGVLFTIRSHSPSSIEVNSMFSAVGGAVGLLVIVEFVSKNNK
ncbi:MAG: hypothetical protein JWO47_801 [Candidatus Saccharibacteria bacterium]|nr:hypothetical protein [Candidatus Saccharibacteria bacterium]